MTKLSQSTVPLFRCVRKLADRFEKLALDEAGEIYPDDIALPTNERPHVPHLR
jgi:hypothetical protein